MIGALADLRNRKAALLLFFVSWDADWLRHTRDLLAGASACIHQQVV
jgi:hypothetical protein